MNNSNFNCMKKFYYSLFTAATLLLSVTSCSQEEDFAQSSNDVTTFSISLNDEVGSRAIGDGTSANKLYYEVFMEGESVRKGNVGFSTGYNLDLPLLNGETYDIVFWAQNNACAIYGVDDQDGMKTISVNYNDVLANKESYDAFYNALNNFTADGNTHRIELRRPFAQLNLGTSDWSEVIVPQNQVPVTATSVTVEGLADTFDPFTGVASASPQNNSVTFKYNALPKNNNNEVETFIIDHNKNNQVEEGETYTYLSLNYLLVPGTKAPQGTAAYVAQTNAEKAIVDLTFNLKRGDKVLQPISVPNAPLQRNWRTNIIGKVLTGTSFDIVVNPETDGDNQDIRNIDGIAELQAAMTANGDSENSVTYYVNGLSTVDNVDVNIPESFKANDVTFIFNNIKNAANLNIVGNLYAKNVYVKLPNLTETGKALTTTTINLPLAHVELLQGNFGALTATTSPNTIVIGAGATVGTLTVKQGNVEIQTGGEVEKITNESDSNVVVTLGENVEAPEVEDESIELKDANGDIFVAIGVSQKEGEENAYYISNAEGLKWLATTINDGDTFKGKTIKLAADIDLNNEQWTSAGTEEHPFSGTFDGDGKTIMNLSVIESEAKEGKAFIGLFGYAKDATIKNVTFENVNLNIACLDIDHSQGHIGAVAGSLEGTSTIENVTVKGDIKVYATQDANGASRVAVIAGGNSYGNVTMKNVRVIANEGSYLKANNNTGALAGQLQGKNVFENCSSNINVTVNKFFAGGLIGIAAGESQFTDCHTTGDVAVLAGREGRAHDHYRVGGIAGGWADGAKNVLTITNCSYTGQISGKNADGSVAEAFDYAGYVGRGYTLNGCQGSKVVIDGVEYVQAFNTGAEAGIYYVNGVLTINSAANLKLIAEMVNKGTNNYFEGETIKLGADIDLKNEEWTPIGSMVMDHGFMGNFDGNGKTIKNLKITQITPDADNYAYAGLFGLTEGTETTSNFIKNLTIENVNINTEGHIVSAAIAYPYYTTVENITVKGNITIKGGNYTSGVLAYTRRCVNASNLSIAGIEGSSIEGNQTVGGVISDIQMNGGLTANYSNFSASGLTIEGSQCVGGISGIISQQTLNGAIVKNVTIVCEDNRTGIVSGADGGNSSIENVSYENVTGATRVIGATYDGGYYIGQILEEEGVKAIVYATEGGVKAVSVEELPLKGKKLSDATTWATSLGEGWALASIEELDAIHAARKTLNVALVADNTENALFCETDYYTDGKYALYLSSTEATGNDPKGEAYLANRVHVKYFNLNGYWDYPLSTFATINISAPLKDNYFARAVYTIGNKK